ncbi:MAG: SOS response-associated peptidase family protein, partial [Chloroflexi bacterium]|nr:SOS response-associated peptidase family protein [Chloroflexota bacterium]MCI0787298.1 SOS response-associated peptidase family protein [Chloroflexota bacterium]MCI0867218.1 SOS response-associated peptidase family protein [Chloroflexota bacterium]
ILTTKPNEFMEPIHNRMPVILSGETEALWLDPMTEEPDVLQPLIQPAPAELMESRIVSSLVNSPKNNSPECVVPITGGLPGF